MKRNICVVIAHKYNDVYYAVNTDEFIDSDYKILITVEKGSLLGEKFPFKELFDSSFNITKKFTFKSVYRLIQIFQIVRSIGKVKILMISNPLLVVNQIIHRYIGTPSVILLEDGLMNYSDVKESNSFSKKKTQKILGISTSLFTEKICKTYLNQPESAKYLFGKTQKIELHHNPQFNDFQFLLGKKIFVGGDYYRYGFMTIEKYCEYVNEVIQKYSIDFYLPHPFASSKEKINCSTLNLGSKSVTLEMLAGQYTFSIFSFGSTCSFTCKNINKNIETAFIVLKEYSNVVFDFLKTHSDLVLYLSNN